MCPVVFYPVCEVLPSVDESHLVRQLGLPGIISNSTSGVCYPVLGTQGIASLGPGRVLVAVLGLAPWRATSRCVLTSFRHA